LAARAEAGGAVRAERINPFPTLCSVGRGLAPAAGNWNNFRIFRRKIIRLLPEAMWVCIAKPPAGASPALRCVTEGVVQRANVVIGPYEGK